MDVEWWDKSLRFMKGGRSRLKGLDVFYEFDWRKEFGHGRAMFPNGTPLADLVKRECPAGLTPTLLLTVRDDVDERGFEADGRYIVVANARRIRRATPDVALSHFAARLGPGITAARGLSTVAADPGVIKAVVENELTIDHVRRWLALDTARRLPQLRELSGDPDAADAQASIEDAIEALQLLEGLDAEVVDGIRALLGGADREARLRYLTALAQPILGDEEALRSFIRENWDAFATLVSADVDATDILALARRRVALEEFEKLLTDDEYFAAQRKDLGGPEKVWQSFIEENSWVIGSTIAPQFLHSWSESRLEQTVKGFSIGGPGKRSDAVLRTAGVLSALVLAEIKHHQTALLDKEYRPGSWSVSGELAGGVAQCQATADAAARTLGPQIDLKDADGHTVDRIFVCRPRTVLVVGSLSQFRDSKGNVHAEKFESLERFRRGLRDPEVVTFDELYERARFLVALTREAEEV